MQHLPGPGQPWRRRLQGAESLQARLPPSLHQCKFAIRDLLLGLSHCFYLLQDWLNTGVTGANTCPNCRNYIVDVSIGLISLPSDSNTFHYRTENTPDSTSLGGGSNTLSGLNFDFLFVLLHIYLMDQIERNRDVLLLKLLHSGREV